MDFFLYVIAGAAVGFTIGLTGVGGGSLMTPLLILFGFPYHTAIGTDLVYAALTKASGVTMHARRRNIDWRIVGAMAAGSLPASIVTVYVLHRYFDDAHDYQHLLTGALGAMLIATALVLLFKGRLQRWAQPEAKSPRPPRQHRYAFTALCGLALGVLVTLSSVGAGAFGTALLMVLFPALAAARIVGTDLAHAVPLTLIAGAGHFFLGHVDVLLLASLLVGSIPAIYAGTRLGSQLPEQVLQPILASMLLILGVRFAFF